MVMTVGSQSGIPAWKIWRGNFWFLLYAICVQNQWGIKLWDPSWGLWHWWSKFSYLWIECVFAFQIWYYKLCVKKLMRGRQKALVWFLFLFFLAFSQLNISWKFEVTTFPFSLSKVSSLCHYFQYFRENGN